MAEYKDLLFIILFAVIFTVVYWIINREFSDTWALMRVENTPNMFNNDESAIDKVIPLVKGAEEILEIYDDGDNFPGSIYNNEDFVQCVEEKLDENKNFRVECLFNNDDSDLLFTKRLARNPQVDILVRRKGGKNQVHYKIMDRGLKAYLSVHVEDSKERAFKEVDCSKVPKRKLDSVTKTLFEDIRQDINNFEKKEI